MRMKYTPVLLFVLLFVSSCEKDFNINAGNVGNQAVLNCLWNDNSQIQVYYTKPFPIGSTNNFITSVPDARIDLYEDNVYKETLQYVRSDTQALFGSYLSSLTPQQGRSYTIKTFEPNYANAWATDTVPVQAQLITSALQQYDDSVANTAKMYLVFRDNPAVQNYYRINVWIGGTYRYIDYGDTSYYFQNNAIAPYPLNTVNDTVRDGLFLLFSDRGFNGQEKNLQLSFNTIDRRDYTNLNVHVELHTVSHAHYEYFQTLNLYRNASYSAEPVYVYSNITNGLGAFVAEHIQVINFTIK